MTEKLKTAESAIDAILIRNTDNEWQDEEEPTVAVEEIVEIFDKAELLNDSSNSNSEDSDNG